MQPCKRQLKAARCRSKRRFQLAGLKEFLTPLKRASLASLVGCGSATKGATGKRAGQGTLAPAPTSLAAHPRRPQHDQLHCSACGEFCLHMAGVVVLVFHLCRASRSQVGLVGFGTSASNSTCCMCNMASCAYLHGLHHSQSTTDDLWTLSLPQTFASCSPHRQQHIRSCKMQHSSVGTFFPQCLYEQEAVLDVATAPA